MEMERHRARLMHEMRAYRGSYSAEDKPDPADKLKVGTPPPKHIEPVVMVNMAIEEKSPETKRKSALDRVIAYSKSLKW